MDFLHNSHTKTKEHESERMCFYSHCHYWESVCHYYFQSVTIYIYVRWEKKTRQRECCIKSLVQVHEHNTDVFSSILASECGSIVCLLQSPNVNYRIKVFLFISFVSLLFRTFKNGQAKNELHKDKNLLKPVSHMNIHTHTHAYSTYRPDGLRTIALVVHIGFSCW